MNDVEKEMNRLIRTRMATTTTQARKDERWGPNNF
jgi:hypothetical protein